MSFTDSKRHIEGNLIYNVSIYLLKSYQYITFCLKFRTVSIDAAQSKSVYMQRATSSVRSLRTVQLRIQFKGQGSAGKCSTYTTASNNINNNLKFMAALQNVI